MTDRSEKLRTFYAQYIARRGGAHDPRIEQAFAAVPREPFAGPAPWFILTAGLWRSGPLKPDYLQTPDDDPAFLYQDVLVALDRTRGINIGEPSLHARCLDALALHKREIVLQIGAGSGYYTAIIAHLVGPHGHVHAFEIDPDLAARAKGNLVGYPWVDVQARSGIAEDLPQADAVYVNAGLTQPSWTWLGALRPGGRLLFPLQPEGSFGGMLLIEKPREGGIIWPARFVSRAGFIACQRARQDSEMGRAITEVFANGRWQAVKSFRLDGKPDATCCLKGEDWWLSSEAPSVP